VINGTTQNIVSTHCANHSTWTSATYCWRQLLTKKSSIINE